ncbi:sulfatase [Streptomyces sp. NPDC002671]
MSHLTARQLPPDDVSESDETGEDSSAPRASRLARGAAVATTVLAAVLVLGALLLPNHLDQLTLDAFLRIPAEAVLLAALLLVLPPRTRGLAAVAVGLLLGLLTVLKCLDMGFYSVLERPFDLVLDWVVLDAAADFLCKSFGRTDELLALGCALLLALALLVLTTLAMVRLTRLMARHRQPAMKGIIVLGTAWIVCVTLGLRIGDAPVAAKTDAELVANRVQQVRTGLQDAQVFRREVAADAFAHTPRERLLAGLRGKDVLFTFVESYGRTAIEDPAMAPRIGEVLKEGTASLKAAGFAARSGWLGSPVTGGGSWLAHSTFMSGLWISNQQRFRNLTSGDRMTLTRYFRETGAWRTAGIVPGVERAWPEGRFFGLEHVYDAAHLGYHGPRFGWSQVPDQFTLEAFRRLEFDRRRRGPLMAEIILTSSHHPWAPVPRPVDWADLGDGSVFRGIKKQGKDPEEVWKNPESVRTEYRNAIAYSLRSLVGFLRRYGDERTVLVFLGDHQPVPAVTSGSPRKDVPVTIVAHDPKILARISGWGWTAGLKPAADAPVWPMSAFRDRFMRAYGPPSH